MDYKLMKKDELLEVIKELEPLAEKGKEFIHLPKAIESKDKEINRLQDRLNELKTEKDKEIESLNHKKDRLIDDFDSKFKAKEKELQEKYNKETLDYKTKLDEELKKTKDALAESQKKNYDLDALRIKQLEEVLYAYGDFLKLTQAAVDSHMKLNEYIVNGLQGGSK